MNTSIHDKPSIRDVGKSLHALNGNPEARNQLVELAHDIVGAPDIHEIDKLTLTQIKDDLIDRARTYDLSDNPQIKASVSLVVRVLNSQW